MIVTVYSPYLNSILFFVESLTESYRIELILIFVIKRLINFFSVQKPATDFDANWTSNVIENT